MSLRIRAALAAYYLAGRHLPESYGPLDFGARRAREFLVRHIFASAGSNIDIQRGVYFGDGDDIEIQSDSGIGLNARIQGPLQIGRYVMMGPDVIIYTRAHNFDRTDVPMSRQGDSPPRPVIIEDDVWIGARVMIMPGVRIGRGCVIAAGAVVTRDIPPFSIAAGVPARPVRVRGARNQDLE